MSTILFPYAYIPDPDKGKPLALANIFIGKPGLDPQIEANRIQVFEIQEDGTPIAISQPIKTGGGGVPINCCSPAVLSVEETSYSMKITDKTGVQKYFQEFISGSVTFDDLEIATATFSIVPLDDILSNNLIPVDTGVGIQSLEYVTGSGVGAGLYEKVSVDPGDNLINPPTSDLNWLKLILVEPFLNVTQAGVVGDGVADDTAALNAIAPYCVANNYGAIGAPEIKPLVSAPLDFTGMRYLKLYGQIHSTITSGVGATVGYPTTSFPNNDTDNTVINIGLQGDGNVGTTGIRLQGLRSSTDIYLVARNFDDLGVDVDPGDSFVGYNDIHIKTFSCDNGVRINANTPGFVNENRWYLELNGGTTIGTDRRGLIIGESSNQGPNHNVFYKPSLESYAIWADLYDCAFNIIEYPRWENPSPTRIRLNEGAGANKVENMYLNHSVAQTVEDDSAYMNYIGVRHERMVIDLKPQDFLHYTAVANQNWLSSKAFSRNSGTVFSDFNATDEYFEALSNDQIAIIIPVIKDSMFRYELNIDLDGLPDGTSLMAVAALDAAKADLPVLPSTADLPYIGTSFVNREFGTSFDKPRLFVTKSSYNASNEMRINRPEVEFIRFEIANSLQFRSFSLYAIDRNDQQTVIATSPHLIGNGEWKYLASTADPIDFQGQMGIIHATNVMYRAILGVWEPL